MGLWASVTIGIGGMIGAGIFSVLGTAGRVAGPAAGVSFALAGLLALACAYSFGRLGARFPSAGGPVEFLTRGFGNGVLSGTLNLLLWAGYVLALALYARAFGNYGASLMPDAWGPVAIPGLAVLVTLAFLGLNIVGAEAVGRAEVVIVGVKVLILLGFVAAVAPFIETARIAPTAWPPASSIGAAAAIVFLSYEGFGLITNAAEDMRNPRTTLPRAIYISVAFTIVVYVSVAFAVLGALGADEVARASEYVLARAAAPVLGATGFTVMAVAALFSTASAINATLYGGANVSSCLAEKGGLPLFFKRQIWAGSPASLLVTSGLVALIAASVNVERIAMAGSAAFLIVYAGVNLAHLRLLHETRASKPLVVSALLGCIVVFAVLVHYLYSHEPIALVGVGAMGTLCLGVEWIWRRIRPEHGLHQRGH